MGNFREAVAWMGGFIGIQPGMYFLGLVFTSFFSSPSVSGTSQVLPPGSSCNADVWLRRFSIWVSYLIMMMVFSILSTYYVRVLVETDAHSRALRTCGHANEKVEKNEPNHDIACIAGWRGKVVRPCFCLAIAFSFGSSVCAIVSLYLSVLQFGCANSSPEISIPFAVVGVMAILVHGFFGFVAITQN